jgi:hypothetical protein
VHPEHACRRAEELEGRDGVTPGAPEHDEVGCEEPPHGRREERAAGHGRLESLAEGTAHVGDLVINSLASWAIVR